MLVWGSIEDLVDVRLRGCDALQKMDGVMADPAPFMLVEDLGDYNVLVRFFGWVDQRTADFAKVRGEAIRQVKTTLEDAGVEMPEPIQTIRMERVKPEPAETEAAPASRVKTAVDQDKAGVDVSPDTQLDDQISEDLAATQEPNLLTEA